MTADHHPPVRHDPRQGIGGWLLRKVNPLVRRMVVAGLPTGAPNILLTVAGRRTGKPRTVPVGMVMLDGRMFVQASYGEGGWVGNLRAAGEGTVTERGRRLSVQAVELSPEEGGAVLQRLLRLYRRSRLLRAMFGTDFRPPIGVLWRYHLRVDETLDEYVAEARRHPLFELRPVTPR